MRLNEFIRSLEGRGDAETFAAFLARAAEGHPSRDENPQTHFSVYFAGYDPTHRLLFMGHHKKSGLWLFNGGHMDAGELSMESALREIGEEWGLAIPAAALDEPQLLTITDINPALHLPCQVHYDFWYFVPLDSQTTVFDAAKLATEFYTTRWLTPDEARPLALEPATHLAIDWIEAHCVSSPTGTEFG